MFALTISPKANNKDFLEACDIIENRFVHITKEPLLIDVDGSLFQKYTTGNHVITVVSDYDYDCVFVEATINLSNIFSNITGDI